MKITMYELLGMIKDGKAPKKIKYDGMIWEYDGDYYISKNNTVLEEYSYLTTSLNDTVEILEENKIPEKLCCFDLTNVYEKINEIIDYLDYLNSKGE